MGTNFYWLINPRTMKPWNGDIDEDDVHRHIGKRSFAGAYCDDCGVSLSSNGMFDVYFHGKLQVCPGCGKSRNDVGDATSFTWTMMKHKRVLENLTVTYPNKKVCCNEYCEEFTAKEMLKEADCKIVYQNAVRFA